VSISEEWLEASAAAERAVLSLLRRPGGGVCMDTISVRQPIAAGLLAGVVPCINRDWRLPGLEDVRPEDPDTWRGATAPPSRWLALHTGLELHRFHDPETGEVPSRREQRDAVNRVMQEQLQAYWPAMPRWSTLPTGAVLGAVQFVGVVAPGHPRARPPWAVPSSPWCWLVGEVLALPSPLAFKGQEGLFPVDVVTSDRLRAVWRELHPAPARAVEAPTTGAPGHG